MPASDTGKYKALMVYIVLILVVACVLTIGGIAFYRGEPQRPGQPSPHALDQTQ